jgi:hypothetical protein
VFGGAELVVGIVTGFLLAGGLTFTIYEMRRSDDSNNEPRTWRSPSESARALREGEEATFRRRSRRSGT